jgi:hypothetical protein
VRDDIARATADVLVTADLLGHTTHGLALLAPYLVEIEKGTMTKRANRRSSIRVRRARRGTATGSRHLAHAARIGPRRDDRDNARDRHDRHRRSHHIACLAVYLLRATGARARRDRPELGSDGVRRGSSRRHHARHHAESDRRRFADIRATRS